jgi:dihydrofolate synthase/folylpolyglutamate synthase
LALAIAASESFLGRPVAAPPAEDVVVRGRLERVAEEPLEIWDGAHNLAGVGWLLARLPSRQYVVVVSILADKDADGMLAALSALGDHLVATSSSNERALSAEDLAARAERFFPEIDVVPDPSAAIARARQGVGEDGAVLVTGSLYLLADLVAVRPATAVPWRP